MLPHCWKSLQLIGNIVATPASAGHLWGMPDAKSTSGAVITEVTGKLEETKKTISDMETLKDSARSGFKSFEDLGPSGKRKRCALLETKLKIIMQRHGASWGQPGHAGLH